MTGIDRMLGDAQSPLAGVLDRSRIDEIKNASASTMTWLNPSHLLLPLLEVDTWMRDYGVTFR
jgi:asparagine synthase (glutamine-hydrolysing)